MLCFLWPKSAFFYYDFFFDYLGSWGMMSLRTETGKHFVQVFKMWLKVGGKNQIIPINDSFGRKWYTPNLSSSSTLAV